MTITKKILFFLGAVFFLTCSSTYIKVQAAQDMPDKSVQIGKKTTMQVKDSTLSTQNKAAWIWKSSERSASWIKAKRPGRQSSGFWVWSADPPPLRKLSSRTAGLTNGVSQRI